MLSKITTSATRFLQASHHISPLSNSCYISLCIPRSRYSKFSLSSSTTSSSGLVQNTATTKKSSYDDLQKLNGEPLQSSAGLLSCNNDSSSADTFIPQYSLYEGEGRTRKRVLVLCTGGTLTMAPDPKNNGALTPVEGKTNKNNDNTNTTNNNNQASVYFMFLSLRSHSTAYVVASSYCFSKYRSNI
jgi:hypothetical protein